MAWEIYKALDVGLRQQITAHLRSLASMINGSVSDDAYGSGWNGVTDVAPSQNAVYDKTEAVDDRLDDLEGFRPSMMQFDGSSYYRSAFTSSGNKVTVTLQFQILPFTGDTECRLLQIIGPSNHTRASLQGYSSDYTTTARQGRVLFFVANSSGTPICALRTTSQILDGNKHSIFASFDGDTGAAVFVVDGDNAAYSIETTPTTGTLDSGAGVISVAAQAGDSSLERVAGNIGFIGYREAALTNWDDFFTTSGNPINIDAVSWTEFGSQPEYFNPHGQMTKNLGSEADMAQTGAVSIAIPGNQTAQGLDDPTLSLESQITALAAAYYPAMMDFDGSTGYYSVAHTSSGNKWTVVARFKLASFSGASANQRLINVSGVSGYSRINMAVYSSNHSTTARRNRLQIFCASSTNVGLWNQVIDSNVCDDEFHLLFASFDADTGTAVVRLDGAAVTYSESTQTPTTGTVESGAGNAVIGASTIAANLWNGEIGFIGLRGAALTNWSDFMQADGLPKLLDESGWSEWGAQPAFWNPHGQMTNNLGSAGNMTKNGTINPVVYFPPGGEGLYL